MSTLKTPFRYDFVGSFLRPESLKQQKKRLKKEQSQQEELEPRDGCVRDRDRCKAESSRIPCDYRWGIQKKILAFGFPCRSGWCRGD